jgi:sugar-phosphatase
MDGLLIDSEPLWHEAALESLAPFGIDISTEEYNQTTGLRTKEFLHHYFSKYKIPLSQLPTTEEDINNRVIEKVNIKGQIMPGVMETLSGVHQQGLKIGLASSSPMKLIHAVLNRINAPALFSVLTSAEHLPFGKPNPQVFIQCAEELDSRPTECLCFEDSFNGLIAAKAARMKCVVVPHPDQYLENRWTIADLKLKSLTEMNWDQFRELLK